MFDTTEAACATADWKLFFPEGVHKNNEKTEEAKKICASCPIAIQCLAWALQNNEFGIWGGTTERERQSMTPRKKSIVIRQAQR